MKFHVSWQLQEGSDNTEGSCRRLKSLMELNTFSSQDPQLWGPRLDPDPTGSETTSTLVFTVSRRTWEMDHSQGGRYPCEK